jgi:hypothetical protein
MRYKLFILLIKVLAALKHLTALKLSFLLIMLGLGLTELQAQIIYLREKSGTQTSYSKFDIKRMSISSGNLLVEKVNGSTDTYSLESIRYLNFANLITDVLTPRQKKGTTHLVLFPNPTHNVLEIKNITLGNHTIIVEIISVNGLVVYKQTFNDFDQEFQVNVSSLPKGIYLCRIINGMDIKAIKFLKY